MNKSIILALGLFASLGGVQQIKARPYRVERVTKEYRYYKPRTRNVYVERRPKYYYVEPCVVEPVERRPTYYYIERPYVVERHYVHRRPRSRRERGIDVARSGMNFMFDMIAATR